RYLQPDVVADFSRVRLMSDGPDRVRATGASGQPRPDTLKVTVGYHDGYIGEGQMSYGGPGCLARGQLALALVRQRLQDAGLGSLETRCELIGVNSLIPQAQATTEPNEVRLRVAVRAPTHREALLVANEVEALYTNGPAAGGGATKSVREVIAAAAVLVPRDWAQAHVTVLD
ncbi:MAG: acyclic terpene utilization AtuA family protein, partial [Limnohabitans sp.]